MQVTETLNEGLKARLHMVITNADLEAKVDEKLKEAQPQVEIQRASARQSAYGDAEKAVRPTSHGRSDARVHRRRCEQPL